MFFETSDVSLPENILQLLDEVVMEYCRQARLRGMDIKVWKEHQCWVLVRTMPLANDSATIIIQQVTVTIQGQLKPNGCTIIFAPEAFKRKPGESDMVLTPERRGRLATQIWIAFPMQEGFRHKRGLDLIRQCIDSACTKARDIWVGDMVETFW